MLRKIEGGRRRGTEDEMVGWQHRLSGHEFEQTPGVGVEQTLGREARCAAVHGLAKSQTGLN